jgi:hypothetical protein
MDISDVCETGETMVDSTSVEREGPLRRGIVEPTLPTLEVTLLLRPGNRQGASLEALAHEQVPIDMKLALVSPVAEVPQPACQSRIAAAHHEKRLRPWRVVGSSGF